MPLPEDAYARLLQLRTGLRHFEAWSAKQARAAGLTPAHHQLLLAIRGHGHPEGPTIGEVADYLLLRHHSTVGLVDRAEAAGLVRRARSKDDHRVVRLQLTKKAADRLEALSALHLEELQRLALNLPGVWEGLAPVQRQHGFPGPPPDDNKPSSPGPRGSTARKQRSNSASASRPVGRAGGAPLRRGGPPARTGGVATTRSTRQARASAPSQRAGHEATQRKQRRPTS